VDEKEPFARTAGKYVRAAGIAIQKERQRRAAEAEQRAREEEQERARAVAAAPPAPSPPPQAAPAPPPPPPAQEPARAARSAPQPLPRKPIVDRLIYFTFLLSVLAVALAALQVQMVTSGDVRVGIRLVLGGVLILSAIPLLTNWQDTRRRLTNRFFRKLWGLEEPTTRSGRVMRKIAGDLLTLVGIAWLAFGVFEILRAFIDP